MNQLDKDKIFLNIAYLLSEMSHCSCKHVCAIAVKNGRIISTGINGTIKGHVNCDDIFTKENFDREKHHAWSQLYEVHAEANLLIEANKNRISLEGSTVYLTLSPCNSCSLLLATAGIKRLVYSDVYDKCSSLETALKILRDSGVEVENVKLPHDNSEFTVTKLILSNYNNCFYQQYIKGE